MQIFLKYRREEESKNGYDKNQDYLTTKKKESGL